MIIDFLQKHLSARDENIFSDFFYEFILNYILWAQLAVAHF